MPPKEVLILDAGFSAVPLVATLNRQSYRTMCMGCRPFDPGHALAHEAIVEDYSDREAVLDLCRTRKVDCLVPGVTDVSYQTGAYVAEKLGFPGFDPLETMRLLFDKRAFRRYARSHAFPAPGMAETPETATALDFPVLVKPVDAYSGLGLEKLENMKGLDEAMQRALRHSKKRAAIVEEFVEGSLHSHSAFIQNGKITQDFFVDEFCTVFPWTVNCSYLSRALPEATQKAVRECLTDLARDLRLADGLLHTQFIYRDHRFWLIEITRRCPGDLYGRLIQEASGLLYFSRYLQAFLGEDFALGEKNATTRPRHIARHTVSSAAGIKGGYGGIRLHAGKAPARLLDLVPLKRIGEPVRPAPHDRVAVAFLEFEQEDALRSSGALLAEYFEILALEVL
jgi:biotin carboxylase